MSLEGTEAVAPPSAGATATPWPAYVVPMAIFSAITAAEAALPALYVPIYTAKLLAVTTALIYSRRALSDIAPSPRVLPVAVVVGLLVLVEWIAVDRITPHLALLGGRSGFDPFSAIANPVGRWAFIVARLYGLALMVPVMEELFWRSFLLRWLTRPDFAALPIGQFSWMAFALTALLFAISHPEWLAALLCAVAYGLLLRQTRSLYACVVAHAVTNAGLAAYVLSTGAWRFW